MTVKWKATSPKTPLLVWSCVIDILIIDTQKITWVEWRVDFEWIIPYNVQNLSYISNHSHHCSHVIDKSLCISGKNIVLKLWLEIIDTEIHNSDVFWTTVFMFWFFFISGMMIVSVIEKHYYCYVLGLKVKHWVNLYACSIKLFYVEPLTIITIASHFFW